MKPTLEALAKQMFFRVQDFPAGKSLWSSAVACGAPPKHLLRKGFRSLSKIVFSIIAILALTVSPLASAADFSSQHFMIRDPQPEEIGGSATSSNFMSVMSGSDIAQTEGTSTNFTLNTGPMFFESFKPVSQKWRWFDDAENETPSTPLADEDVAPSNLQSLNVIKLRITVAEEQGISAEGHKFRLQYATSSAFSDGGSFVKEESACTVSSEWCYGHGGGVDDAVISTAVLSDPDPCVAGIGDGCGTHNESGTTTSSFTHTASTTREYEFTIQADGATPNTVYFFRVYDNASSSSVPVYTGETYPSISTSGSTLTFSIDGLASTTATEGVTTDIDTTPESVPFGQLLVNTPVIAAHRLIVSTNATQGYKIFTYQQQGLLGNSGQEVTPVSATNEIPASWSAACSGTAPGCYGYHTGEDVLEGGSTRFAANDTYARFSVDPKEIAYSAGPVNNKNTDVIYKVEAHSLQAAGDYDSSIVYIVTPVF